MLGNIDSNIDNLNLLHESYDWLPNENLIRPNNNILIKKKQLFEIISKMNLSFENYIINIYFNNNNLEQKLFIKNPFPYDIKGNHYIMWYYNCKNIDNETISNDISINIYKIVKNNNFNFAWYENPKMSIPSEILYHVQVFWVNLNP